MNFFYLKQNNESINNYSRTLNVLNRVVITFILYMVFGLLFQHVYADEKQPDPYQSKHGSVWLQADDGTYTEAIQMQTDVDYAITGAIARATVKQRFKNNSESWAEGIYVFPLPEKAAVDHFRMIIGERIIEGQVKERVQARKTYERAKSSGKKTSLIEQQRPNVFTTSLANIAPGENISVEFEYQQVLDYKDQQYRLRFPMVVGPRYHPGNPSRQSLLNNPPDQTSVYTETAPLGNSHNPTRIHILLDAGVNLSELKSSYHRIDIKQTSETRYSIATIGENIIADRDFELVWKPQLDHNPQLTAFGESDGENSYAMITLFPPELDHLQQKIQARDVIFVLDISGSMGGTSIEQAKASLITALDRLTAIDRFNVIWFNDQSGSLFDESMTATGQEIKNAKRFVNNLQASGGTEMLPALKLALSDNEEFSRFRQVVFLTDGNISNEAELFNVINQQLGSNRLFTIGIGSAPNSYFMRKAANIGRGTFTYISDINEVETKTVALLQKLETPALINIQLDIDHDKFEVFPNIIPDLYAGETTTVLIKGDHLPKRISVRGDYGNIEWSHDSELLDVSQDGIRVAWAREKIASLMSLHHETSDMNERDIIQEEVTETAITHHLVSRYTSLVAVDITPVNLEGMLLRQRMKNNLPHGWKRADNPNGIMLAQTATDSRLKLLASLILFIAALFIYRYPHQGRRYI